MRKLIFSLTASLFAFSVYAQNTPTFEGSREEAIKILRNSEFMNLLRYLRDEDPSANIERFIREVNKIVPVDQQKHELLKTQLLSYAVEEKTAKRSRLLSSGMEEKTANHYSYAQFVSLFLNGSTRIEGDVLDILKDTFSTTDYATLSEQLSVNLTKAISAYKFLLDSYKADLDLVVIGFSDLPEVINQVYEYFGI